jgi:thiamine pyrophosphokinase
MFRPMTTVLVLAGGPDRPTGLQLPAGAKVIAANSGVELARELGLKIDLAVGDFDSISEETLQSIEHLDRHPAEKDASDLELALTAALRWKAERILVLGGAGGRLDHLLGAVLLLAADAYAGVQVDAQLGAAAVHLVRRDRVLEGEPGELISLFALHQPASGVTTEGLLYPLHAETLEPSSSRGLSNLFTAPEVRIRLERGVLLAVRPSGSVQAGS